MGCFTMRDTTQNIGCKYDCEKPAECQHRGQSTHAALPSLAYAKNSSEGDICLCKGDYCNSIGFTDGEISGIVLGALAAAFLLCCLLAVGRNLTKN